MAAALTTEQFRLFIALPMPMPVKEELGRVLEGWRKRLGNEVRWTQPGQIHLTLKFLGNVPAGQVEELTESVRGASSSFAPFRVRAGRIGFFPDIRHPRVIWAWVHDDHGQLPRLQRAVDEATARFASHKEEQEFTGHLTIGRVKAMKPARVRLLAELARGMADRVFGDWTVDKVEIMRSELSPAGSSYSPVAEVKLAEAAKP